MGNLTKRELAIFEAALILAHNICVARSDRRNADDRVDEAREAVECAKAIERYIEIDAESVADILSERDIPPGISFDMPAGDGFYLQDKRSFVGNDMLFWAADAKGYTTDLRKAHVYTLEKAQRQHDARDTDIPWPKAYIDARARPAVDFQHVDRDVALQGSGIKLQKPQPRKKPPASNCVSCGRFVSESSVYCQSCGTFND